jgi:hypothetical protein
VETFTYDIHRLNEAQKDEIIELFNAGVGQIITITEHHGALRTGFLVTPVNEILTMKDGCWYDLHFEFMANVISNILGDSHDDITIDTPIPGDDDYIPTVGDPSYYRIYAEDDSKMYAENDDDLWIEGY